MRSNNRVWRPVVIGVLLTLGSCGEGGTPGIAPPPPALVAKPVAAGAMVADEPVIIGAPYSVGSKTYTPEDVPNYDAVGLAGWYGEELQGNKTANGELFMPSAITAAHQTLPLPSYVEVTALDTGRTIVVRINDRGPYSNDRILDLSRAAAEQLGVTGDGAAAVRVRRVNPSEQERAILRAHGRVAERLETPPALLTALRAKLPRQSKVAAGLMRADLKAVTKKKRRAAVSVPAATGVVVMEQGGPAAAATQSKAPKAEQPIPSGRTFIVQVAAFSSRTRADALAQRLGVQAVEREGIWRVRFGPYPTQDAAKDGIKQAAAKGFKNVRIMANDGP